VSRSGLGCAQLVAGAHFEEDVAEAKGVHRRRVSPGPAPNHRVHPRRQPQQRVFQASQPEKLQSLEFKILYIFFPQNKKNYVSWFHMNRIKLTSNFLNWEKD